MEVKQKNTGALVISLDFELMWGMIDISDPQNYGKTNVAQVPEVIDRLLYLFEKHQIHATFAAVGFISYPDKNALLRNLPSIIPSYDNSSLSPYFDNYINKITSENEHLYFAPHLIEKIRKSPGMELGTHTFCHYYCTENGQSPDQFRADLQSAKNLAQTHGYKIESIIFPRNQVTPSHLEMCRKENILVYRGNPKHFFNSKPGRIGAIIQRIARIADNYFNISGCNSYKLSKVPSDALINIPASRFLRPYSNKLSFLDPIRLRRIKREMTHAARHGEIYHLWWHPHNFGKDINENFSFLEKILNHYDLLRQKYGMKSLSMIEAAQLCL